MHVQFNATKDTDITGKVNRGDPTANLYLENFNAQGPDIAVWLQGLTKDQLRTLGRTAHELANKLAARKLRTAA